MGTKSTVKRLPGDLRKEVDRLFADGRYTLDEIKEVLGERGIYLSRSALGRYRVGFERLAENLRHAREMASALNRDLGAEGENTDVGRMAAQSMQALLVRAQLQLGEAEQLDARQFAMFAMAAKDLQAAIKSSVETEMKIRDRVKREAAAAAEKVGAEHGLSADVVDAFKRRILGLGERAT